MKRETTNRLMHLIAEATGADQGTLDKLRHDITCGIDRVVEVYAPSPEGKREHLAGNEVQVKLFTDFEHDEWVEVSRVRQWHHDCKSGMSIRKWNGYEG